MTVQDLARRIVKLEETVAELGAGCATQRRLVSLSRKGQFMNDPVYDEIVSRGPSPYRRSLRPKPREKKH